MTIDFPIERFSKNVRIEVIYSAAQRELHTLLMVGMFLKTTRIIHP